MRNNFSGDPHFNNVLTCVPLRGNLIDYARIGQQLTTTGTISIGSDHARHLVSGSQIRYISLIAGTSEDFTCEGWFAIVTTGDFYQTLIDRYPFTIRFGNSGYSYKLQVGTNTNSTATTWSCALSQTDMVSPSADQPKWFHVAFVRYKGAFGLFVNGIQRLLINGAYPSSFTDRWVMDSTSFSYSDAFIGGNSFNGYSRDVRFTRGVARYISGFIPPIMLPIHGVAPSLRLKAPIISLPEAKRPPVLRRKLKGSLNEELSLTSFVDFSDKTDQIQKSSVTFTGSVNKVGPYGYNVEHDNPDDRTVIAADSRKILPTNGNITIFSHIYPWGAATGYSHGFGVRRLISDSTYTTRCGVHFPYTDGKIYWDYGGVVEGTTRLSVAMPSSTHRSVYAFTVGPRGMEIWHNGVRIASNSATPTRVDYDDAFGLGYHSENTLEVGYDSNRFNCYAFGVCRKQLPYETLQKLTASPEDMWEVLWGRRRVLPTPMLADAARPPVVARRTDDGGDPYFNNVVLQLPLRSHLRDESKTTKAVTVNGDTKVVNGAAYFDGTGDSLAFADSADFDFGTGDYTIECEVKLDTVSGDRAILTLGHYYDAAQDGAVFYLSGGYIKLLDNYAIRSAGTLPVTAGRWSHLAWVKRAGAVTYFVDGQYAGAVTSGAINPATYFGIGYDAVYNIAHLQGSIRHLRVTRGIARYVSNFTPPTYLPTHGIPTSQRAITITNYTIIEPEPGRKVLYLDRSLFIKPIDIYSNKVIYHISAESGTIKDLKGTSLTLNNTTVSNIIKPFGRSSMYFNGSNTNVSWDSTFDLWSGQYTIDGYMYCIAGSGANINSSGIICYGLYYWGLGVNFSNQINLYYWTGIQNNITTSYVLPTNKWVHFAISYNINNNTVYVWINGVRVIWYAITPTQNSTYWYIGGNSYTTFFNGYIKNMRFSKGLIFGAGGYIKVPKFEELMLL